MMNRLLKELAEEAGYPDYMTYGQDLILERFAELIVRECARIVPDTDLGDVDGGDSAVLRAASKQIREHFGVE
jgi:hypothetical protein